jgi:hypothetical protein
MKFLFSLSLVLHSIIILVVVTAQQQAAPPVPEMDHSARVKQHRQGARGDLVEGEEDLRKIKIQWKPVEDALEYQVCHNCVFDEYSPEEESVTSVSVGREGECGGRPCFVLPGAPQGRNTFHVRVRTTTGDNADVVWSEWSEPRNFNVGDHIGETYHEEL